MIHMKRYLVLLILLFAGVITGHSQVQERFKTRQPDSTDSAEQVPADEAPVSKPKPVKENFWDKIVIGGNASLSVGTYTFIYLAPSVGYKFTDELVAGAGLIYQYARIREFVSNGQTIYEAYESSVYGPKFFANYLIAERFYGGAQFEYLNHDVPLINPNTLAIVDYQNVWTPVLFLEAGMMTPIGSKGFAQIGLRYNVLHGPESPYGSPFFPVIGFFF